MSDELQKSEHLQKLSLGAVGDGTPSLRITDEALRAFQRVAVDRGRKSKRFGFCHETGLGKTVMCLATMERIFLDAGLSYTDARTIILGGTSAVATWLRLVPRWMGINPIEITGSKEERAAIWARIEQGAKGVWVTTYDTFWRDVLPYATKSSKRNPRAPFEVVIGDEVHKARNRKTKKYEGLAQTRHAQVKLVASATLASRGPQDLWAILHWMDPKQFPSYWAFIHRWCLVIDGAFGLEIVGVKDTEQLRTLLSRYLITDTWDNVYPQMPKVTREIIPHKMSKKQRHDYEALEDEAIMESDAGLIVAQNALAKLTYMRQISICPAMVLPDMDHGWMIAYLADKLDEDPFTVVFSPYTEFGNVLKQHLPDLFILDRSMSAAKRDQVISAWRAARGTMFLTIQMAESFDLSGPRTAYFAGFEWDPNLNIQAEGRLRRLDSIEFDGCHIEYLVSENSVDYAVKAVVDQKISNVRSFMRPEKIMALIRASKAGEEVDVTKDT